MEMPSLPTETPSFPSEPISDWEGYKTYVSKTLGAVRGKFLFRGQRDETWELSTTFHRTFKDTPSHRHGELKKSLVKNFRKECEHYPEYRNQIEDDIGCLALAQHHGLPTPLLDWTESPYMAAYFAFQEHLRNDGTPTKRVAIWIIDTKATRFWSEDTGVELISPPAWHNERLRRQLGWFTYAKGTHPNLEKYVVAMNPTAGENPLRKVTLPASQAQRALSDLDLMGISARELFADLAGAARNAYVRTVLT